VEVYNGCTQNHEPTRHALSAQHSTWFIVLHSVFSFTKLSQVTKEQWLSGLAAAMQSNYIECMPGSHRSRITSRRVVKLVGYMLGVRAATARPGSLKREAIEAESRANRPVKRQAIDLGNDIPFATIPATVEVGFKKLEKMFAKGNERVFEHYHVARNCLEQCLGDPLCDLLLMIVLTLSSSTVTPCVAVNGRQFEAGKRKEPDLFAANLATRMLWFLRPEAFPWDKDAGMVLRISEMTKKIEHKGVNNRVLRQLGWVQVKGNRDTPRNSELRLQEAGELLALRSELLSLRKQPASFIRRVFGCDDDVWVERCSGIVYEQD
jgi:hypothetical protein